MNRKDGISLIVLVITIIVIIILAAAIIVSIINNNPMTEANRARYQSDRDNMQYIFTNTVGKIMVEKKEVIGIKPCELNTEKIGPKNVEGEVIYTIDDVETGKVIFNDGTNEGNNYCTGKKLPIYSKETTWKVDSEGILILHVGKEIYGEESQEKDDNKVEIDKNEYENLKSELESKKDENESLKSELENIKKEKEILSQLYNSSNLQILSHKFENTAQPYTYTFTKDYRSVVAIVGSANLYNAGSGGITPNLSSGTYTTYYNNNRVAQGTVYSLNGGMVLMRNVKKNDTVTITPNFSTIYAIIAVE